MKKLLLLLMLPFLLVMSGCSNIMVLNPKGPVAQTQHDLIMFSIWFMLGIVIIIFSLFGYMVYNYREKKQAKDYEPPEIHGNTKLEIVWTVIPIIIVIILSVPKIKATYKLEEPTRTDVEPVVIHVTSADWKWIFSYPEENIETVNYLRVPEDTPIEFKLTSATNMNSFWVPELGGQKYSMGGMETKLYLEASEPGDYEGRSANFSGKEFTHMTFTVEAQTQEEYKEWVKEVKEKEKKITETTYKKILEPGLVGRQTYTGTHLEWVDHAKENSHGHGEAPKEEKKETENHDNHTQHGGEHH